FYRDGILAGTDQRGRESWYGLLGHKQLLVEAAAVASNIYTARSALWDPFSTAGKRRVIAWLTAAARIEPFDNNWRLFVVTVRTVIKLLDGSGDDGPVRAHLDRFESFYLGDGWYADGVATNDTRVDYYNFWSIHPELLFWCLADGDADPARRDRILERTRSFMDTFPYWFGANGSYPCFGRSGLYRGAILAVVPAALQVGASRIAPGQLRRICRGVVEHFLATPGVLDDRGTLSMGFAREYLPMTESYSGPGSPYWFGKAFGILALASDHDFWTAPEEPLPVEHGDFEVVLGAPALVLHGTTRDGQVQLLNAGSVSRPKKYTNLCYSSHFGFEVRGDMPRGAPDADGDASLTFSLDGSTWYGRFATRRVEWRDGVLLIDSDYRLGRRGPSVRVRSAIKFCGVHQLRVHEVASGWPVLARECGFACGSEGLESPRLADGDASTVSTSARTSGIRPVVGYDIASRPVMGGHNVLFRWSAIPTVRMTQPRSGVFLLASASWAVASSEAISDIFVGAELDQLTTLLSASETRRSHTTARLVDRVSSSMHRIVE
ncbi:MAG: DUF2264 domain-containing protein, partial [Candidatus Limnocylindria bacterium]